MVLDLSAVSASSALRVVGPSEVENFAKKHDAGLWRCLVDLLQQISTLSVSVKTKKRLRTPVDGAWISQEGCDKQKMVEYVANWRGDVAEGVKVTVEGSVIVRPCWCWWASGVKNKKNWWSPFKRCMNLKSQILEKKKKNAGNVESYLSCSRIFQKTMQRMFIVLESGHRLLHLRASLKRKWTKTSVNVHWTCSQFKIVSFSSTICWPQ